MKHCCKEMEQHIASGNVAIRFLSKFREYGISYRVNEDAVQIIRFCPWCGRRLPDSLRGLWFDRIEELGLMPGDPRVPTAFQSDEWYSGGDV